MPATDNPTRALPTLHEFFSPGGILARSSLPYEYRPGQLQMAKAVERALEERRHLIVEAGTGTGKTLAYLLPALRTGLRIIVSTGTKALQDQLYFRDVPFLETLIGDLRVCYMKGRANYLCRHKLVTLRNQPILSGLEEIDQYRQISEWEKTTETGDRAEIDGLPESSALWQKLDARSEACLGTTCPDYRRCFITEMRRKALESDIIIVNHHLFFADLSVKRDATGAPDAGVLPEAAAVVFDEAHELEDVASSYFGLSVSNLRFEELARDTDALLRGKPGADSLPALTQQLRDRARIFFAALPMPADGRQPFTEREQFLETSGDLYLAVRTILQRIELELDALTGIDESPGLRKRVVRLRSEFEFLLESNASNMVYWMERRTQTGRIPRPHRYPLAIAPSLHLLEALQVLQVRLPGGGAVEARKLSSGRSTSNRSATSTKVCSITPPSERRSRFWGWRGHERKNRKSPWLNWRRSPQRARRNCWSS